MDEIWQEQEEAYDSLAECERAHYEDTLRADPAFGEWLDNLEDVTCVS